MGAVARITRSSENFLGWWPTVRHVDIIFILRRPHGCRHKSELATLKEALIAMREAIIIAAVIFLLAIITAAVLVHFIVP